MISGLEGQRMAEQKNSSEDGIVKYKYLFGVLFFFSCICFYFFHLIYTDAKNKAISELNSRQMIHAKQAGKGIEDFFDNLISSLTNISKSNNIIDLDDQGKRMMNFSLNIFSESVTAITRVDELGKISYTMPYNQGVIGRDISSQKHVQKIMKLHTPVMSGVFTAAQGYKAIALHVPVFKGETFRGTIAVLIDFNVISKRFLNEIKVGETGYPWMTSQEGIELYGHIPDNIGKSVFEHAEGSPTVTSMAKEMVMGRQGVTTYIPDHATERHIKIGKKHAVYMPVTIVDSFWSIVVASSENEVLASLVSIKNRIMILVCLLFFVGILFSYYGMKAWGIVRERQERLLVEKALRKSENKYRTLFESSVDAISILDLDTGKFIDCNTAAINLHGVETRKKFIGLTPDKLSPKYQPNGELSSKKSMEHIQKSFADGSDMFEWTHCRTDGSTFPSLVSLSAIEIEDKKMILALGRDLTEIKQNEEDREKVIQELYKALSEIKTLRGILPVCCVCGLIRDDTGVEQGTGEWMKVDKFVTQKTDIQISHSYCPVCHEKEMEDV